MNKFSKILGYSVDVEIDDTVFIGENVVLGPRCKKIKIGYGSFIGRDIYIDVDFLEIGDYTTIHHGSVIHGLKTKIGHNCWIGHYVIIDSLGGDTVLGNNVGVGAHSQLWSHMKFGDTLNGCRWNSSNRLHLDDDVWLVGHSIVGPIHAESKSMLLTGGVATGDMESNEIYAGSPARKVTEKFGNQFDSVDNSTKLKRFFKLREDFCIENQISEDNFQVVKNFTKNPKTTEFIIESRQYQPIRSEIEHKFIKYMLYDKAKWIPFLP